MDTPSWQETTGFRSVDSDGYVLKVWESKGAWRWSISPPGGGYATHKGKGTSSAEARSAAEDAYRSLKEEIARSWEELMRKRREDSRRRGGPAVE